MIQHPPTPRHPALSQSVVGGTDSHCSVRIWTAHVRQPSNIRIDNIWVSRSPSLLLFVLAAGSGYIVRQAQVQTHQGI